MRAQFLFSWTCTAGFSAGVLLLAIQAADWSWQNAEPTTRLGGTSRLRLRPTTPESNSAAPFRVITAPTWPPGLVPIFEVECDGYFELRRRPPVGRENITDPLFFGLPREDEPTVAQLAGRWLIQATNVHGGKHWTYFELTVESGKVAGRFDQNTDFRFAFLTGGRWNTNQLHLDVEYIQDRYELTAEWHDGNLVGTWRQHDDSERGTWMGTRPAQDSTLPTTTPTAPLWEWRRLDGARRYGTDTNRNESGWERSPEPLCRVWLP